MSVALDLANLLERDPQTDLTQYVREQYRTVPAPVLRDDGGRPADHQRQPVVRGTASSDGAGAARAGRRVSATAGRARHAGIRRAARRPRSVRTSLRAPVTDRRRRAAGRRRRRAAAAAVRLPAWPIRAAAGARGGRRARRRHGADIRVDLWARTPASARSRNGGAPVWRRRSHRPRAGARRRRDRRGGSGVQSHGQGPVGSRRARWPSRTASAVSCWPTSRTS